jgi:hypothetical protein
MSIVKGYRFEQSIQLKTFKIQKTIFHNNDSFIGLRILLKKLKLNPRVKPIKIKEKLSLKFTIFLKK